jgi:hypothetical protein
MGPASLIRPQQGSAAEPTLSFRSMYKELTYWGLKEMPDDEKDWYISSFIQVFLWSLRDPFSKTLKPSQIVNWLLYHSTISFHYSFYENSTGFTVMIAKWETFLDGKRFEYIGRIRGGMQPGAKYRLVDPSFLEEPYVYI